MKTVCLVLVIFCLAAFAVGLGTLTVSAQGPVNNGPATALYIDNLAHTIPGNSSEWFKFNYGGGNSLTTVALLNGANSGLHFDVYTPEQVMDLANETPIGRGTVQAVSCNTGSSTAECVRNDLRWEGKFHTGGTYYVQLFNDNPAPAAFTLTAAGDDVVQCWPAGQTPPAGSTAPPCPQTTSLPPSSAQSLLTPTAKPITSTLPVTVTVSPTLTANSTPTSAPSGNANSGPCPLFGQVATASTNPNAGGCNALENTLYTDPFHGLFLNNQTQTIPANSSMWFRFGYGGGGSPIALVLTNGVHNGLTYKVYTPAQIAGDWWDTPPIGQGTARLTCTPQQTNENPPCSTDDLFWTGGFQEGGFYAVKVNNPTQNAVPFLLRVTGNDVALCPASPLTESNPPLMGMAALCSQFGIQ